MIRLITSLLIPVPPPPPQLRQKMKTEYNPHQNFCREWYGYGKLLTYFLRRKQNLIQKWTSKRRFRSVIQYEKSPGPNQIRIPAWGTVSVRENVRNLVELNITRISPPSLLNKLYCHYTVIYINELKFKRSYLYCVVIAVVALSVVAIWHQNKD